MATVAGLKSVSKGLVPVAVGAAIGAAADLLVSQHVFGSYTANEAVKPNIIDAVFTGLGAGSFALLDGAEAVGGGMVLGVGIAKLIQILSNPSAVGMYSISPAHANEFMMAVG